MCIFITVYDEHETLTLSIYQYSVDYKVCTSYMTTQGRYEDELQMEYYDIYDNH